MANPIGSLQIDVVGSATVDSAHKLRDKWGPVSVLTKRVRDKPDPIVLLQIDPFTGRQWEGASGKYLVECFGLMPAVRWRSVSPKPCAI